MTAQRSPGLFCQLSVSDWGYCTAPLHSCKYRWLHAPEHFSQFLGHESNWRLAGTDFVGRPCGEPAGRYGGRMQNTSIHHGSFPNGVDRQNRVYSPGQLAGATMLGAPIAGSVLLTSNFALGFVLPDDFPSVGIGVAWLVAVLGAIWLFGPLLLE
jgi:hypothetical protein